MGRRGAAADSIAGGDDRAFDTAVVKLSSKKRFADADLFRLMIGSRLWITALTMICVCVLAALINFHFEQRSTKLTRNLELLVEVETIKNELIAASIILAGTTPETLETNLEQVKARIGRLSAVQRTLNEAIEQNRFSGLEQEVLSVAKNDIPELLGIVFNIRLAVQTSTAVNMYLVQLVEFGMHKFRHRTTDIIHELNTQKRNLKDLRILTLSFAVGVLIFAVLFMITYVFRPLERRLAGMNGEMKSRTEEFEAAQASAMSSQIARSEFLGRISHEIRTPLNGMLATSQMLCSAGLTENQRSLASAMVTTTKNLTSSFENVICYSELVSGEKVPELKKVRLKDLHFDLIALCKEHNTCNALESSVQFDETLPEYILCDRVRLLQLLGVLIDNAYKYTTEGSVNLRVWQQPSGHDPQMPNLVFCVQDTGIGIAAEKQDVIFKEFTQVDNSLTRAHDGLGLGLALALRIANHLGGKLRLNSRLNHGSRFYLELPCRVVEGGHEQKVSVWEKYRQYLSLMIVSGNASDIRAIRDRLPEKQFDVSFVESASAAARLAKAANNGGVGIDAVILGREFLEGPNPAFELATLRNAVPYEAAIIGLGSWCNWSSVGVFRSADVETLERDILSGVTEKGERMNVLSPSV